MRYNVAFPYFPEEDIRDILDRFKYILSGNGLLSMDENVTKFEREFAGYVGTKFAVSTNSCTSALEVALKAIGIKDGDEVIVPTQTFIATGSSVAFSGGKIVFCETDDNFLLDFEDLKKRITNKTRAVIIVHFVGLIHPQIFEIKKYLKERDIYLIEDAAHAHGAKINETFAGNIGDIGCFSFYSTKIMTTGEGGMITVNDDELYNMCDSLRNRGLDTKADNEIFTNIGSNRRLTEFQAILGMHQLKRLEEFIKHRNRIADIYKETLKLLEREGVISFQRYPADIRHAYWRFLIFLKDKNISRYILRDKAGKFGIKIDFPYIPLLHLQPVFRGLYGIKEGFLKRTEALAERHFCLPIHMKIKDNDARYIGNVIRKIIE